MNSGEPHWEDSPFFWTIIDSRCDSASRWKVAANQVVPELVAGVGGGLMLRCVKRDGRANIARYAI